jgi:MYXO-CTERM domain-containing protein
MRGVLLLFAALAFPATASAQPFGTRLSYDGDPTTSIAVGWSSPSTADTQVVIGTAPDALSRTVTASETFAVGGDLQNAFTAHVDGLTPGTVYHYRVGGAGGTFHPPAGSPPFSFRTLPADRCTSFRVMVIGDNRADLDGLGPNPIWREILDEALLEMPDVFVNTGDMVKNGDDPDEWAGFFDASERGLAAVPSLTTMGNHDDDDVDGDGAIYNRAFGLPRNSETATEDYYSLDVGPIHFVSLNTQYLSGTQLTQMTGWLDADLGATTQPYKIVFFHKAVYSRGNHHTGEERGGALNQAVVPVLDRHAVDLVFNGHSHDYERFAPSRGLDSSFGGPGRTFPVGDGAAVAGMTMLPDGDTATTYIVTGGAGAFVAPTPDVTCLGCRPFPIPGVCSCDTDVLDTDVDGTVMFDGRHNYVVLDVDGPEIRVRVHVTRAGNIGGGRTVDSFTLADSAWDGSVCGTGPPPDPDGGVPGLDGGTSPGVDAGRDSGTSSPDTGPSGGVDSGPSPPPTDGSDDGGCGCRATAPGSIPAPVLVAVALLALLVRRRR